MNNEMRHCVVEKTQSLTLKRKQKRENMYLPYANYTLVYFVCMNIENTVRESVCVCVCVCVWLPSILRNFISFRVHIMKENDFVRKNTTMEN